MEGNKNSQNTENRIFGLNKKVVSGLHIPVTLFSECPSLAPVIGVGWGKW